jgi:3-oxoacyl-[acyl-carrier protein] reductase
MDLGIRGRKALLAGGSAGMVERRWGRIVNIGTFAAKFPLDMRLMSGPARAALVNYTAVVSRQLARHGVLLNNVLPGMFGTEGLWGILDERGKALGVDRDGMMKLFLQTFDIPTGAVGEADDLAPQVALLCSERARFTVGQNIVIDGGQGRGMF